MKNWSWLRSTAIAAGMFVLILDGKTAVQGAYDGLQLCIRTVIPSLLPFIVLSTLLTDSLTGIPLPLLQPVSRLFRTPSGTEPLILAGFLGGYPVGAQSVSRCFRDGRLSASDARRMLGFCSNAGPAFLFGMVGPLFPGIRYAWILWSIHIISAFLVSLLLPAEPGRPLEEGQRKPMSLSQAVTSAVRVMALICGWVILFRVILAFVQRWVLWMLPVWIQVLAAGLLELSNGCCQLPAVSDVRLRATVCSVILAFGGLCVTMQTAGVSGGIPLRTYLLGKWMQAGFSLALCGMVFWKVPLLGLFGALSLLHFARKMQKGMEFPVHMVYNGDNICTEASSCCFERR